MGNVNFNNDERMLINSICKNEPLSTLTKDAVLRSLKFSRQIVNEKELMVVNLMDGIISKVQNMTDSEWDEIKMNVPLDVAFSADADGSEEISDEDK